jgi:hypothetical protein
MTPKMKRLGFHILVAFITLGLFFLFNIEKWIGRFGSRPPRSDGLVWKEWIDEDGSYRILMPGTPYRARLKDLGNQAVRVQATGWEVQPEGLGALFFIFSFEAAIDRNDTENALENACITVPSASNGKLLRKKQISMKVFQPGKLRSSSLIHWVRVFKLLGSVWQTTAIITWR